MVRTYKFKLYRSKKNKHLHQQIDIAGLIYNHCIALNRRYYRLFGKSLNKYQLMKHLTKLKKLARYSHWNLVDAQAIQDIVERIDKASAIQWLRQLLKEKPQTSSDINPQFMQQLGGWSKNEAQLDLRELLTQNFLTYDGKGLVPEQIHAYLSSNWKEMRNLPKDDAELVAKARDRWYVPDPNKAGDLEKLRERALLKEFEEYKQEKKKLKVFRLEAVRAGFKKAWQEREYATIVRVADKIPSNVLEEDPKLLMWYDQAVTRMGSA